MGHIKEPTSVDLNIEPMSFTSEDRQEISAIIARYKNTGEIPNLQRKRKAKREPGAIATSISARTKGKVSKRKPSVLEPDK